MAAVSQEPVQMPQATHFDSMTKASVLNFGLPSVREIISMAA